MHPSAQLNITDLRKKCRNNDYSMLIHRPARAISIYFTKFFLILGFTANMVSALGFFLFLVSFVFFIQPDPLYRTIGIVIMLVAELFDYVDGELSRAYGHSTKTGMFLEPFFQDINYTLIFVTVGSSLYFETKDVQFLYLGLSAALGKVLFRLLELRFRWHMLQFGPKHGEGNNTHVVTPPSITMKRNYLLSIFYGIHRVAILIHHNLLSGAPLLYFLVIALYFGRLDWFVWFFGIILPIYWIALAIMRVRTVLLLKGQEVHS